MSSSPVKNAHTLTPEQRERKKRFLNATLVTCLALAMVFGVAHVVKLGANRMADMRSRATYDVKEEALHIRAAGEDIARHQEHQVTSMTGVQTYGIEEVNGLLNAEQWAEFSKALDAPPKRHPGLERLLNEPSVFD